MMKILHIITSLKKAAGTSVFVGELSSQQAAAGHTVAILIKNQCDDDYPVSDKVEIYSAISHFSLLTSHSYDVVHIHALWDPWLTKMALRYRRLGSKIVWSPHGMLTPWALKNHWPKKLAGLLAYQYWSLRAADLIHVTADTEAADIRRLHLKNKLVLAPLGVYVPDAVPNTEAQSHRDTQSDFEKGEARGLGYPTIKQSQISNQTILPPSVSPCLCVKTAPYLCFVSRIQRKKGLPNLLRAWAQLPASLKRGWQIKIAGPDEDNHLAELYTLCEELKIPYTRFNTEAQSHRDTQSDIEKGEAGGLGDPTIKQSQISNQAILPPSVSPCLCVKNPPPEIEFLGPVYDAAKDALYANAAFSVLPTHSENFGSVVIESLAQGTPVICTKGAPWRDLVDYNCGWWIDIGVAPLVTALTEALNLANSELSTPNSELPTLNSELPTPNSELSTLNSELSTLNSKLRSMGANGQRLVREKYSWPAVCRGVLAGYKDIT